MKQSNEDVWLIAIVFVVWAVLSVMYFVIPMIQMPTTGRVWGLGAILFLLLSAVVLWARRKGRAAGSGTRSRQ